MPRTHSPMEMMMLAGSGVTVWKPHSSDRSMQDSRNAYGGNKCGILACLPTEEKIKNLKACSACHMIKYCSIAHQKEHWKEHKPWCKAAQESRSQRATLDIFTPPGWPTRSEMLKLMEDFNTAHDWTITRAVASAVHDAGPSFNCRNQSVEISVAWRPESNGNPATLFRVNSACIKPDPPGFSNDVMRVSCNSEDDHNKATIPQEHVAYVLVRYKVDNSITWQTGYPVLKQDLPRELEPGTTFKDWVASLKAHVERGIVYRRGQSTPNLMAWSPGIVEKKGKNWVWKATASNIPMVPVRDNVDRGTPFWLAAN